jgi:hypothetical protein
MKHGATLQLVLTNEKLGVVIASKWTGFGAFTWFLGKRHGYCSYLVGGDKQEEEEDDDWTDQHGMHNAALLGLGVGA